MKSLIECVGLCKAEVPNCNSVFFKKQNLICKLANLLSYNASNSNNTISGELAFIQTGKLQEQNNVKTYNIKKFNDNKIQSNLS
jgi:hypothetical protein